MYYAMTIKDNTITGVHESETPITDKTFAANPAMAGDEVRVLEAPIEYVTGMNILAYNKDGTMKDELYCIEQGYLPLPPNKEIMGGVLVDKTITEEEAPPSIAEIIRQLKADNDALKTRLDSVETKAAAVAENIAGLKEPIKEAPIESLPFTIDTAK